MWKEKAKDIGRVEGQTRTRQGAKTRRGRECWLASNWIPPIYHSRFGPFGHPSPSSPLVPRIAGIADKNRGRGAAPPVPIYRQKIRWPRRVVTGREPQIRFVERRAEFLVGRGHSHRVQGVVRGSKSYWSWCTPWQMDELFSAASRVLREM